MNESTGCVPTSTLHAELGDLERRDVVDGLRAALRKTPISHANTLSVQELSPNLEKSLNIDGRARGHIAGIPDLGDQALLPSLTPDWVTFDEEVVTAPIDGDDRQTLLDAAVALRASARHPQMWVTSMPALPLAVANDPSTAGVWSNALSHVIPAEQHVTAQLSTEVIAILNRRPVGTLL